MNEDTPDGVADTALVIGGAGSAGNAWVIGVIAGLASEGVDVAGAALTVGTSAGSTAAAQLAGASAESLYAAIVAAAPDAGRAGPEVGGAARPRPAVTQLERTGAIIAAAEDPADMRRRLGAMAIENADAAGEQGVHRWRSIVASRLPDADWPEREILITAVDADSGEPVVFDRRSGVDQLDSVAASCSSGSAYRIGARRYIDGGYRTNADNADLAAGYARVLVLSPFGGRTRTPRAWGLWLASQLDELRRTGSEVETIFPDAAPSPRSGTT